MSTSHAAALADLRLRLLANGYEPLPISGPSEPVKSAGKRPRLPGWQHVEITPPTIRGWARDFAADTNTGIRCGQVLGVDVDVLSADLARAIEDLAIAMLGPTPLRRIGRAPKALLAYRAEGEQPKAETPEFILPDGTKAQIEVLAKGQQFVSHGVHPDTRQAYVWTGQAPEAVALADLPIASPSRIRAFLAAAESLIRDAGGRTEKEIEAAERPPPTPRQERPAGGGEGSFFREVNSRALDDLDAWVKSVFPAAYWQPNATTPPGAWRVASKDLGRGLEEDIAIHAREGCQDFGTRESLTPIDLVMRHAGAADAAAAALWLCERLRIQPESIGWKGKKKAEQPRQIPERQRGPNLSSEPFPSRSEGLAARSEGLADNPTQITDGGQPRILPLLFLDDIQPCLDASDFVEGVLVEQSAAVIYGESNAGKTFFATDLALSVSAGEPWFGREVDQGGVVYCVLEGGFGFRNRVRAWLDFNGRSDSRLPFAAIPSGINLLDPDADTPRLIDAIKTAAAAFEMPVKLVVIDTLARAFAGGNENSSEDMGRLVLNMDAIREATGACVLFIHHSGKDQARGARGHSSLRAAIDTEIEVVAQEDEDGHVAARTATLVKQRELPKGEKIPFGLKVVEMGMNRRNKPVTTCVSVRVDPDSLPTAKCPALSGDVRRAFEILCNLIAEKGASGFGAPDGARSVPEDWWRDRFYAEAKPGAVQSAKQKAFRRASDALVGNRVGMENGRVWVA